jgi:hypothetical protein
MGKNRRAPLIERKSDDFVIEEGGEEYYPHAGESVIFRRRLSPADLMMMMQAEELGDSEDQREIVHFLFGEIPPILLRAIHSWTWTDPYTGEPMELSLEAIQNLDIPELTYLTNKLSGVLGDQEKKEQAPS